MSVQIQQRGLSFWTTEGQIFRNLERTSELGQKKLISGSLPKQSTTRVTECSENGMGHFG